jgi:spermidine synthase
VGLGAGSLPAFLANAFVGAKKNKTKTCAPGAFRVECVEIDRAVAAAAREVLGVAYVPARGGLSAEEEDRGDSDDDAANERDDSTNSTNRRAVPFALRVDDAARYLAHLANTSEDEEKRKRFALICLDAYDGKGEIPSHLKTRAFLRDARLCLAPGGAVVANCFDAPPGSRARENLLAFCEALGGTVAGACAVRVRLLKVEGQESNVVVVAEATEREKKKKKRAGRLRKPRRAARRARRRFRFFAGGGARGAVRRRPPRGLGGAHQ